jgi:hypothetical protein
MPLKPVNGVFYLKFNLFGHKGTKNNWARNLAFAVLNYLYDRYRHMKKAHWFIIFLLFAISCLDEPDCFRLNNNVIGIAFKKMYDGRADTVALIGIQALGVPDTTFSKFLYTNGAYVPLDFFSQQTSLTLQDLYETHQLLLGYDVKAQFVSDDCGARYVLSGLNLLSEDYDSIRVVSTDPASSEAGVHIEIYRCPRTHLMKVVFQQLQEETSRVMTPKINGISPDYIDPIFVDTTLSVVNLPLNPEANTVRFDFDFRDYGAKFLTVQYQRTAWDYNDLCAARNLQFYGRLKVGNKGEAFDFDSVKVVRDSLQDPPITNITAYRCPQTNLMRISFRTPSAPVRADSISVVSVTDNKGAVLYENTKLAIFTLPLITDPGVIETEFTFLLTDGTTKKLTIGYGRETARTYGNACGDLTTLTDLEISTDFGLLPDQSSFKLDHTTFPVQTNFEILK